MSALPEPEDGPKPTAGLDAQAVALERLARAATAPAVEVDWRGSVVIELQEVPPSLNTGTRGRGIAAHRKKKALEEQITWLLLKARLPKGLTHVRGSASLRFATKHRRDPDNYGWLLGKALGDALSPHDPLAPHRWLPDDTAEFFSFMGPVVIEPERGAPRTTVTLVYR